MRARDWLRTLRIKLVCLIVGCDWTCNAAKGIRPTPDELAQGVAGFWHYAQTYCDRCGRRLKKR